MSKPHKYAALIKAWADGAEIQAKLRSGEWIDLSTPTWGMEAEYRIKPEPLVAVVEACVYKNMRYNEVGIDVSDVGEPNVRVTFTDGVLTNAEVIHD